MTVNINDVKKLHNIIFMYFYISLGYSAEYMQLSFVGSNDLLSGETYLALG